MTTFNKPIKTSVDLKKVTAVVAASKLQRRAAVVIAGHCINLKALPERKKGVARRKFIYQHMADRACEYGKENPATKTSLHFKLGRFTQEPRRAANFIANARVAAPDVTPAVWNTQLRLIHTALPFERRRRGADM